ncbi:LOW QUALITY PROTEIN: equilibrative nucleoside transporter 4-like [Diadema antillarum]|uniref:LOW QUALITY PROTEIN: equilibrative nucleoside transporter 4-like n=1 Tax=Diadema antillarum TaxID=105358 RepID=UPI003A85A5B4
MEANQNSRTVTTPTSWTDNANVNDDADSDSPDINDSHSRIRVRQPRDPFNCVYVSLLLAGTGFLLPYNSFVTAVDFFHSHFPNTTIVFDMSLVYLLVGFAAVMLNNALVVKISVQRRILMGQIMALCALLLAAFLVVGLDASLSQQTAYAVILLAVAVTAFGCTVQQSSFYGYAGMLPKRFTQAVMAGESTAGVVTSLNRIITKLLVPNEKINTLIFFMISGIALLSCLIIHQLARRTRLVRHYTNVCQNAGLGEDERSLQLSSEASISGASVSVDDASLQSDTTRSDSGSHSQSNTEVITITRKHPGPFSLSTCWRSIAGGFRDRWRLSRDIWPYMLSIGVTYYITLCLFPGIESEVANCKLHEWMPIILMAIFNFTDLCGKLIAAVPYDWPPGRLVLASCARFIIVPLVVICVAPRAHPALAHPFWPVLFSALLGISNGYFGSVPMILAPGKVPEEHKELAGNVMTVSYNTGLTLGAITAYLLKFIIGPSQLGKLCYLSGSTTPPSPSGNLVSMT